MRFLPSLLAAALLALAPSALAQVTMGPQAAPNPGPAKPAQGAPPPPVQVAPAAPPAAALPAAPPAIPPSAALPAAPPSGASYAYSPWAFVPPPPAVPRQRLARTERRSTGMMVTGIVSTSIGAVLMVTGTAVYEAGSSGCNDIPISAAEGRGDFSTFNCAKATSQTTGMMILIMGAVAAGLGIPLWIVGAQDETVQRSWPVKSEAPSRAATSGTFVLGPGTAALRLTF